MYFDITNKSGTETHRKRWGTRAWFIKWCKRTI